MHTNDPSGTLVAAVITALVTFVIWALSHIYASYLRHREERRETDRCIVGVYAEIDVNTRDMENFLSELSWLEKAIGRMKKEPKFVPHVTDARHTNIYLHNLKGIGGLSPHCVGRIVYFYGLLETLRGEVEGVHRKSFRNISPEGKVSTIEYIIEIASECASIGTYIRV